MGWTHYGRNVWDRKAECDRICTWDRSPDQWDKDGSSGRVVAAEIVGNRYFAAVERTNKTTGHKYTFAAILLLTGKHEAFGYKDFTESMEPYQFNCPRHILEQLSPLRDFPTGTVSYAGEWRKKAWARFGVSYNENQLDLFGAAA